MQTLFAATWWFGQIAVEEAWRVWCQASQKESDTALIDAVEAGTAAVEMDRRVTSVGLGGLPNAIGEVELDAAIMEGKSLRAGAVAGVRRFVPAICLARRVMEQTGPLILVAEGAERFACQQGFQPRSLLTEESIHRWYEWYQQQTPPVETSHEKAGSHDTVGVIGWHRGHLVAACSTSGLAWKLPGRVGDSPIFGAGLYADDEAGAAVATGVGEEIWRFTLSSRVVEAMRRGLNAQQACEEAIRFMLKRKPETAHLQAAVIGVRADGDYGAFATQPDQFLAFFCLEGTLLERKVGVQ